MPGIIENLTGANLTDWNRRLKEFVSKPERRAYMRLKLNSLIRDIFTPPLHKIEITKAIPELTHHDNGCDTFLYKHREKDPLVFIGLSILPPNSEIHEIHIPDLVEERTIQMEQAKQKEVPSLGKDGLEDPEDFIRIRASGNRVAHVLAALYPEQHHFVINSVFSQIISAQEIPFYGRISRGKVESPLQVRSNQFALNELKAGGIAIKNGQLEIHPYSELKALDPSEHELIEQTMVVITSDELSQELALADKQIQAIWSVNCLGYFVINGVKRTFAYIGTGTNQMRKMLSIINEHQQLLGAESWSLSVIELGGAFAGYVTHQDGQVLERGPLTSTGEDFFVDPGHGRGRFFDITF